MSGQPVNNLKRSLEDEARASLEACIKKLRAQDAAPLLNPMLPTAGYAIPQLPPQNNIWATVRVSAESARLGSFSDDLALGKDDRDFLGIEVKATPASTPISGLATPSGVASVFSPDYLLEDRLSAPPIAFSFPFDSDDEGLDEFLSNLPSFF